MEIDSLIDRADGSSFCFVHPSGDIPAIPDEFFLPSDLRCYFERCGGVDLFLGRDYGISIVGPNDFLESNIVILGERFEEDISSSWFVVARTPDRECISIDLARDRMGRCYDSFHEVHTVAGSSKIIASSFTELFRQLLDAEGEYWYWLQPEFAYIGDAYDGV